MHASHTPTWFIALLLCCAAPAFADKDAKDGDKSGKGPVTSVVNEIGKGLEAVGKAVGPATSKAEKAVRDAAKDKDDKRGADRK